MKGKRVLAALALVSALLLTGCGENVNGADGTEQSTGAQEASGEAEVQAVYLKDMDIDKYVTLGEYKGLQVDMSKPVVTEEDVAWEIRYKMEEVTTKELYGITDRAVENGDLINLDYAGYKEEVAFDGGSATDQLLAIGSGQFIPGFEEGLVGVKPGETVDLELTFPTSYGNAELAGADVVFTVTVNYIIPGEKEAPEAAVADLKIDGVSNGEQLNNYVKEELQKQMDAVYEDNYETNLTNQVLQKFLEGCTFGEFPVDRLSADEAMYRKSFEAQATAYGIDLDMFAQYFYGQANGDTLVKEYTLSSTKQLIATQAVANKENLTITDEELESMLLEQAKAAGFETIEEYVGDMDKETYREFFTYDKVLNFLVENASITK